MSHWRKNEGIARSKLQRAIKNGELIRPGACELCGSTSGKMEAHHHAGYDSGNETNVWWICRSCNQNLKGEKWHSGLFTKEQVSDHINRPKVDYGKCKATVASTGQPCKNNAYYTGYCGSHQPIIYLPE